MKPTEDRETRSETVCLKGIQMRLDMEGDEILSSFNYSSESQVVCVLNLIPRSQMIADTMQMAKVDPSRITINDI